MNGSLKSITLVTVVTPIIFGFKQSESSGPRMRVDRHRVIAIPLGREETQQGFIKRVWLFHVRQVRSRLQHNQFR